MGDAMQMAVGILTASLDSHELEAWAVDALLPHDPAALGDFLAGLHALCCLLMHEIEAETGRPPAQTLQRLAVFAEMSRGTPFAG